MKRTTIELPDDLYFYAKRKALAQQELGDKKASLASVIRDLLRQDMKASCGLLNAVSGLSRTQTKENCNGRNQKTD